MRVLTRAIRILILGTLVVAPVGHAFEFSPTETEWTSWPGYCKAKYAWTNIGKRSPYADRVSAADRLQLEQWENVGIRGLHHYCAGTALLNRARLEDDSRRRDALLESAYAETRFSIDGSDKDSPMFPFIAVQLTTVMHERGDSEPALALLEQMIVKQPQNDLLYSAKAVIQRKVGRLEEARDTLLRGSEAVDEQSAEIIYNLGLVSLELGDRESAEAYAEKAYAMGFPLPGLRIKLRRQQM